MHLIHLTILHRLCCLSTKCSVFLLILCLWFWAVSKTTYRKGGSVSSATSNCNKFLSLKMDWLMNEELPTNNNSLAEFDIVLTVIIITVLLKKKNNNTSSHTATHSIVLCLKLWTPVFFTSFCVIFLWSYSLWNCMHMSQAWFSFIS